ncbi:hypothetical protein BpHYR1_001224 [Brachionus plicatilis]|uniref:Uncharacterized protein n=1 Tax=Brachionus plicatilis TaxID=10195 RepID=A0A3M7SUW1_BRAPC|nr:hypothetical protein BpHYR1_001224 [Brachionus plicatilis]
MITRSQCKIIKFTILTLFFVINGSEKNNNWKKKLQIKTLISLKIVKIKIQGSNLRAIQNNLNRYDDWLCRTSKKAKPAYIRSEPPKLSVIDTLTIAPSVQPSTSSIRPNTSSEQLSDSLEQPPPSQEVSQPKNVEIKMSFSSAQHAQCEILVQKLQYKKIPSSANTLQFSVKCTPSKNP